MPAVEPKARLRAVDAVGADHLRQAGIGRGKGLVLVRGLILEVVGAAEVVLRARAADGGILAVAVEEELDLALAPPSGVVHAPAHVGAHIAAPARHALEQRVVLLIGQRVDAAELRVEVARVHRHGLDGVGDLVVDGGSALPAVLQRHAEALAVGHLPIAVERRAGVDADGQRGHLRVAAPAAREKVAQRALDGRRLAAVPVDAQDLAAPVAGGGEPDVPDDARAGDVGQRQRLPRLHVQVGVDLPARAQVAGGVSCGALLQRGGAAASLFAGAVLGADGARLIGGNVGKVHHKTMPLLFVFDVYNHGTARRPRCQAVFRHAEKVSEACRARLTFPSD